MTVSTSEDESAEGSTVGAADGVLAIEAAVAAGESVLARRFGSTITLVDAEDLAGSGPATVVRARVASSSFALPRTLVIKHYRDAPTAGKPDPFAQEAVSYQLFTALAPEDRVCPELLAHDGADRVLVIDDLGDLPTLEDELHGSDARAAETALLSWARGLGRMHASTAGREADFNALLRRLGAPRSRGGTTGLAACAGLPSVLAAELGVATPDPVRSRAERAAERARTACFRAFSPVDLRPDNNLVTSEGVRFLDFEQGEVRTALVDAGHMRVPFVSADGALALPPGMSEAMVAAWRSEVSSLWPALADEDALSTYLLDSELSLVWTVTCEVLPALTEPSAARPTGRAAALTSWWRSLSEHAERGGAGDVAEHSAAVSAALESRFGPGVELALYPAFR